MAALNRFEYALTAAQNPAQETLANLSQGFASAVASSVAEGESPEADPAVLVLGAFIAFHTHADVNTTKGYRQLLSLCEYRNDNHPAQQ